MLGNHWLLAALVDLALLFAVAVGVVRRRWSDATDLADRFLPVARLVPPRLLLLRVVRQAQLGVLRPVGELRHLLLPTSPPTRSGSSALQLGGAAGVAVGRDRGDGRDRAVDPVAAAVPPHPEPRRGGRPGVPRRAGARSHPPVLRLLVGAGRAVRALPAADRRACGWRSGWARSGPGCSSATSERRGSCTSALVALPVLAGLAVVFDVLDAAPGAASWAGCRGRCARSLLLGGTAAVPAPAPAGAGPAALRLGHVVFLLVPLLVFANGLTPVPRAQDGLRLEHVRQPAHRRRRVEPLPRAAAPCPSPTPRTSSWDPRHRRPGPARVHRPRLLAHLAAAPRRTCPTTPTRASAYRRGNATVALAHASDDPELVRPAPAVAGEAAAVPGGRPAVAGAMRAHVRPARYALTGPVRSRR